MPGKSSRVGIYSLILILLNVIWGGTYVTAKLPLADLKPVTLAFLRFGLASLMMIPFLLTKYRGVRMNKREILVCCRLGFIGIAVAYIFMNMGLKYTKTMNAALEVASEPITMVILAAWLLREKITGYIKAGIFLSTSGVLCIVLPPAFMEAQVVAGQNYSAIGDVMILVSTVCCSLYTIWGREVINGVPSFVVTAYAMISGTIFLFPCAVVEGGIPDIGRASAQTWLCVIYLSLLATAFAYFVWYYLLEKLDATFMGNFINIQPLVGILLGYFFLNEPVSYWVIIGGALVVCGVYVTTLNERTSPQAVGEAVLKA